MLREKEVLGVTQLDNEFFEEYKHLERLCSDMYSCRDGVRQYLEGMESHSSEGERIVPNWKRDYWKLRGLRKTRNVLAHNMSAYQVCTEQDVEDVKNFADRIIMQKDPLAVLNRAYISGGKASFSGVSPYEYSVAANDAPNGAVKKRRRKNSGRIILWILLILTVCALTALVLAILKQAPF